MKSHIANKLIKHNLVPDDARVLDLGSGEGRHSKPLTENPILVDKKFGDDIRAYKMTGKYDIVLSINVLPFLDSKSEIRNIIRNAMRHLEKGGVFVLSLWGENHAWADQHITHSKEEVDEIVNKYKLHYKEESEGMVTVMNGDTEYWHGYELWLIK